MAGVEGIQRRWLALLLSAGLALSACGVVPPPSPAPSLRDIHVDNQTTVPISLSVNGVPAGIVPAQQSLVIPAAGLPPGAWTVEARVPSGRVVATLSVLAAQVSATVDPNGQGTLEGFTSRVDLSCGRLDMWVAVPILGPPPGPGSPGDCD